MNPKKGPTMARKEYSSTSAAIADIIVQLILCPLFLLAGLIGALLKDYK